MDKNGNITLSYDTWKDGIASTPLSGMGDIVNIDIFDKVGVAKIDYKPVQVVDESDITDTGTKSLTCCAIDSSGNAIIGSEDGDVVEINSAYTVTEFVNVGVSDFINCVQWKGFTIFTEANTTDDEISLTAFQDGYDIDGFANKFESMANGTLPSVGDYRFSRGAICVGVDDVLYVGGGNTIMSITEDTTFNPGDSGTYTPNYNALDLPEDYNIDAMVNFNDYLLIFAGNRKTRTQAIFPWDRVSASFEYPTILNNGVAAEVISVNNLAYFLDGTRGDFKVTNRSVVDHITELDNISFPKTSDGITQKSGAITHLDDVFLVGISNNTPANATDPRVSPVGVYKVKNGVYTRQTLSEGFDGSTKEIRVQFITPFQYNSYLVGWQNVEDTTYGVDAFGYNSYRMDNYGAYMESPLYQVGTVVDKKSYTQLDISLAKELATGQGVRVSFRKNLTDDWTTIATFDYATHGALAHYNTTAKITDVTTVQLKVELTTGSNSITTPELISVNLF